MISLAQIKIDTIARGVGAITFGATIASWCEEWSSLFVILSAVLTMFFTIDKWRQFREQQENRQRNPRK